MELGRHPQRVHSFLLVFSVEHTAESAASILGDYMALLALDVERRKYLIDRMLKLAYRYEILAS